MWRIESNFLFFYFGRFFHREFRKL